MSRSVFVELRFWLMLLVSVVLPLSIYGLLLAKRAISRWTVLLMGFMLVTIAGLDLIVLQNLAAAARRTPSLADDAVFLSEVSVALYLFPAMFGGVGINLISHVLVRHLVDAENRFALEHRNSGPTRHVSCLLRASRCNARTQRAAHDASPVSRKGSRS